MKKIFYYELRRVLFGRMFPAMLAANGIYAWYVLTTEIIAGVAYTAPFSVWSYCNYIGRLLPAAVLTVLLLLAGYYGKKQKQAEVLLSAAPITPAQHLAIRSFVLGVCFCIICALYMVLAAVFYRSFFAYGRYAEFLLPAFLLMAPCFLVSLGLGHLLGRLHQGLVWLFAGIVFLAGLAAVNHVADLFCAGYFAHYPLELPPDSSGEPGFSMQPVWVAVRIMYALFGIGMISIGICGRKWRVDRDDER